MNSIPTAPVLEGRSLEDFIQQFVAGISGLSGPMVRPRWQPEPPNIPDYGVDWAAVGITQHRPTGPWAAVIHHSDGDGWDEMQRHEELDILATFYGEHADEYAGNFRNGMTIWQNYSVLRLVGMGFVDMGSTGKNPELIKERWWNRVDVPFVIRRIILRNYPVLNLLSASGKVIPDPAGGYQAPFTVDPPNP